MNDSELDRRWIAALGAMRPDMEATWKRNGPTIRFMGAVGGVTRAIDAPEAYLDSEGELRAVGKPVPRYRQLPVIFWRLGQAFA